MCVFIWPIEIVDIFTNNASYAYFMICGIMQGDISREGEGCGICSDLVMDRGVLDCCDHW